MAHQVLCIETSTHTNGVDQIKKGNIYNSVRHEPMGLKHRGIDMWHELEEFPPPIIAHTTCFVDLPNQEGQSFTKKVDEPVEVKKEELVEQD